MSTIFKLWGNFITFRLLVFLAYTLKRTQITKWMVTAQSISVLNRQRNTTTNNYRGVFIVDIIYKLCTEIVSRRLQSVAKVRRTEEQNGFRREDVDLETLLVFVAIWFENDKILIRSRYYTKCLSLSYLSRTKVDQGTTRLGLNNGSHLAPDQLFKRPLLQRLLEIPEHLIKVLRSVYNNTCIPRLTF